MLSIKDLNLTEQEGLQDILDKHESAWSLEEIQHLTARMDYLSSDDRARLEEAEASAPDASSDEEPSSDTASEAAPASASPETQKPAKEPRRAPARARAAR